MPADFKKQFKAGKATAHVRRKENGVYEIRCQVNGTRVSASAKSLEDAKHRFMEALQATENAPRTQRKTILRNYAEEWIERVKAPYVKPGTLADYTQTLTKHIYPRFGDEEMSKVSALDIQSLVNSYCEEGHTRTAQKICQVLSALFDYAEADGRVERNPCRKIVLPAYEAEEGKPLTRAEEASLVKALTDEPTVYIQAYVLMMYTGLRRAELSSLELSDGWVSCQTAKQRLGIEKRREIPLSPMLTNILTYIDLDAVRNVSTDALTRNFSKVCPGHHLHELRHTFITRCQECGIQREIVSLWAGHAADSSVTSQVYTHLGQNREHQLEEMRKFSYPLPV